VSSYIVFFYCLLLFLEKRVERLQEDEQTKLQEGDIIREISPSSQLSLRSFDEDVFMGEESSGDIGREMAITGSHGSLVFM
jgi:hypothetical protein